jgi:thiamine kinase-like enzyme
MKPDYEHSSETPVIRRNWSSQQIADRIRSLPFWTGEIELNQKFGGLQNRTYFITDRDGRRYVARSGFDQGRIVQTSVVACTRAAANLGIGPRVRYFEPHLFITDYIEGPQLQQENQQDRRILTRILDVMKVLHSGSEALPYSVVYWAPFATVRRYLADLEAGFPSAGVKPSAWAPQVPFFRDVTCRLERAIEPFVPVLTHNDVGFANMMFRTPAKDEIWLIDWDGGGYGNPMWDIGELAMWADSDEPLDRFMLTYYWGKLTERQMKERLRQHVAYKIMGALRLMAECAQAAIDPAYYLSPQEVAESMEAVLPGEGLELAGLVELLRPRFDSLWEAHGREYL